MPTTLTAPTVAISGVPSSRRLLAANLLAVVAGVPAAVLLVLQVAPFFYLLARAGLEARLLGYASGFISYFLQGAVFGLLQLWLLRAYIPRPAGWVLASGLLAVCLLPGLFPATAWLLGGDPALAQVVSLQGLLLCLVAGALFGLLFGGVQSFWLRAGAVRWMACSSLVWALLWACGFPIVFRMLFG